MGYPPGLANEIATAAEGMPLRFWIVDNSGSMGACDGKRICGTRVVTSTRTLELQDDCVDAMVGLAVLHLNEERVDEALKMLKKAYELEPFNPSVLNQCAPYTRE